MIEVGNFCDLRIVKFVSFGAFLDGEDFGEILLPRRYLPEECQVEDIVRVFLYLDSEDRLIATTLRPRVTVGQFCQLQVVEVNPVGVFLDWGLPKDLLAPYSEQKIKMVMGRSYLVHVHLDNTGRIVASSKLDRYLNEGSSSYKEGEEVHLTILRETDLGFKAIINHSDEGMLFKSEIFSPLRIGETLKGFIKYVREDQKIDLTLHKPIKEKVEGVAGKILRKVTDNHGFLPITDKSPAEAIYELFGESKKTFKKGLGALYRKRLVRIEKNGIYLADKD